MLSGGDKLQEFLDAKQVNTSILRGNKRKRRSAEPTKHSIKLDAQNSSWNSRFFTTSNVKNKLCKDDSVPPNQVDATSILKEEIKKLERTSNDASSKEYEEVSSYLKFCANRLFPYQKRGVAKILSKGFRGFLYDDMGLGKTVQALLACALWCHFKHCWPVLIIVPGSLKCTWWEEIEKWLPFISPNCIQSLSTKRDNFSSDAKIILCGYRLLEHHHTVLESRKFKVIILDEAHRTRTYNSRQTLAVIALAESIPYRLAITGTPILIRPIELYSQLSLVLEERTKNYLLDGWASSDSFPNDCHLFHCLMNPLSKIEELNKLFRVNGDTKIILKVKDAGKAFPFDLEYWLTLSQKERFIISQVMKEMIGFLAESINSVCQFLRADTYTWYDALLRMSYKPVDPSASQNFSVFNLQFQLLKSIALSDSSTLRLFLNHSWNLHRFGMSFCNGKKRTYRRLNRDGVAYFQTCWEYNGSDRNMRTVLYASIRPYLIRRRKKHVLHDLPSKLRGSVLVHIDNIDEKLINDANTCHGSKVSTKIWGKKMEKDLSESILCSMENITNIPRSQLCYELMKVGIAKANFIAEYIISLLEKAEMNDKFIVFAIHIKVLEIIRLKLEVKRGNDPNSSNYRKFANEIVTGSMPMDDRGEIVKHFQNDDAGPRVLLLSIFAMGVGFTLTRSSVVIMCELYWSPEILKQAEDRVHRIGQSKSVYVQYMLAPNTIDQKLWSLLIARMGMIESAFQFENADSSDMHFDFELTQSAALAQASKPIGSSLGNRSAATALPTTKIARFNFSKECDASTLCFKVNQVTQRIHLYEKASNNRFVHLKENFLLTDYLYISQLWIDHALGNPAPTAPTLNSLPIRLHDPNSDAYRVTEAFVREWMELSKFEVRRLLELGRPIRAPLLLETSLENSEKLNKRLMSFDRTSHPSRQTHASAINRHGPNSYYIRRICVRSSPFSGDYQCFEQAFLRKTSKPLCAFCGSSLGSSNASGDLNSPIGNVEGKLMKDLFCGDGAPCYHSWQLKCYSTAARRRLRSIDRGICRLCKTNTIELFNRANAFPAGSDRRLAAIICTNKAVPYCPHIIERNGCKSRSHWTKLQLSALSSSYLDKIKNQARLTEGLFWDADHIISVCLGGGSSCLNNFQTLCKPCHRIKTKSDVYKHKRKELARQQRFHHEKRKNAITKGFGSCNSCGQVYSGFDEATLHPGICPLQTSRENIEATKKKELEGLRDPSSPPDTSVLSAVF